MKQKSRSLCPSCQSNCDKPGDVLACGAYVAKKKGMLWRLVKKVLFG